MRLSKLLIASFLVFIIDISSLQSQELDCKVVVNFDRLETTETRIFQDMENSFSAFMSETNWTEDQFEVDERIKCNIIINIQDNPSIGSYSATVQVISARPVYGTDYESVVFNFADRDWNFEYVEAQPLIFNVNSFTSNITSLLAYYAYIVIGYDYDTFSPKGGEQFFQTAWQIVNNAQQSGYKSWEQFKSNRNRYWLAENLISPQLLSVRELLYSYHRQGLDMMHEKPDEARVKIAKELEKLKQANSARPRSIVIISFLDAKIDEIVNLFSEGEIAIRRNAYNILINIDPGLGEDLAPIIK